MITYKYDAKNKFPHMILIQNSKDYKLSTKLHSQRLDWIKSNIGERNKTWTITSATMLNGEKFYYDNVFERKLYQHLLRSAKQYAFSTKEDAMRFKLVWHIDE